MQGTTMYLYYFEFKAIISLKHVVSSPAHQENVEKLRCFQPTHDMLVATAGTY